MYSKLASGPVYYSYYTTPKVDGPTVVYLHGLGGDSAAWQFMKNPTVQAGCNFLNIDLPGHGLSFRLKEHFTFNEFIDSIKHILKKHRIKRVMMVGHCLGGTVALGFCIQNPTMVSRLILINSSYTFPNIIKIANLFKPFCKILPIQKKYQHIDHSVFYGTGDFDIRRIISDIKYAGISSYLQSLVSLSGINYIQNLGSITVPTLILGGLHDKIVPLKNQSYMARHIPQAKLVIIKTNHISVINAKNELMRLILEELRSKF